jgi:prevent-host-death family protein
MKQWPAEHIEGRFNELLRAALKDGPQMVTVQGRNCAVLVSAVEWEGSNPGRRRLDPRAVLLSPTPRFDITLPDRKTYRLRPLTDFVAE